MEIECSLVMMSREERDEWKKKIREQAQKETAREIIEKLFPARNIFNDNDVILIWQVKDILRELAKQLGVEIKE